MEFKGTKGKWERRTIVYDLYQAVFVEDTEIEVCTMKDNGIEALYNALLISKAPEMLEMLIDLRNCKETWSDLFQSDKDRIEKLIKEATEI